MGVFKVKTALDGWVELLNRSVFDAHTIASHIDTTATGSQLNTLTDNSIADTLHRHSELVASDGSPDPAWSVDVSGNLSGTGILTSGNQIIAGSTTEDRSLDIGQGRTGNGLSYVDLIGDTTYVSYGARFIRGDTGPNADTVIHHRGTGVFRLRAADAGLIQLQTNSTTRLTLSSTGLATFTGAISVDDITDSTSTTTGSIHTDGGMGIAKDVVIGGNVTAANLNIANWNTAYGWGDHSTVGYLKADGTVPLTTNWDVGGWSITHVGVLETLQIKSPSSSLMLVDSSLSSSLNLNSDGGTTFSIDLPDSGSFTYSQPASQWQLSGALRVTGLVTISDLTGGPGHGILVGDVGFFPFGDSGAVAYGHPTFQSQYAANASTVLRVMPKGVETAQFEFFNNDYYAVGTAWENFKIISNPAYFHLTTASGSTGTDQPLYIGAATSTTQLRLLTDGTITTGSDLTVGGSLTSLGINDNATALAFDLHDNYTRFGTSGNSMTVYHGGGDNSSSIAIFGGSSWGAGGGIGFNGGTHAQANDIIFYGGSTVQGKYDDSASLWNFQSNAVTLGGVLSQDDTTNSTSATTGSIHTDGGLGVAKNVYLGGHQTFENGKILKWKNVAGTEQLVFRVDNADTVTLRSASSTGKALEIEDTTGSVLAVLKNSGLFGIGTASPTTKLDVAGAVTASGIVSVDDTTNSTSATTGSIHTDGGLGVVGDIYTDGTIYSANHSISASTTESRYLEIGAGRTGNGNAYIDLIGDATYTDYGARFLRGSAGANATTYLAHRGTGALLMDVKDSGTFQVNTSGTYRLIVGSSGTVSCYQGLYVGGSSFRHYVNSQSTSGFNAYGFHLSGNMSAGSAEVNVVYGSAGAGLFFSTWNGTTRTDVIKFLSSGCLQVGSPTGGDKGAGTINAKAVYDDNTLLTDYVFDLYLDKKVNKEDGFAAKSLLAQQDIMSLDRFTEIWTTERRLPSMPSRKEWNKDKLSIGAISQRLWETCELQAIHIEQLNQRIKQLEQPA